MRKYNLKNLIGSSDTEVLLKLYEKFGKKIIPELNGMFSFLIYNNLASPVLLLGIDTELSQYIIQKMKKILFSHPK